MLKWWWLWQAVSLTHFPTPPMSVHSSPSRTHPWSVHSHHDFGFVFLLTHRFWGVFSLTQTFSGAPRVAEAPTHCNSRPCCCFVHPRAKSELFSPHAGPLLLESSRRKLGMSFPCIFLLGASFSSRTRCLGHFSHAVSHACCLCLGCCLPHEFCRLWVPISFWTTVDC